MNMGTYTMRVRWLLCLAAITLLPAGAAAAEFAAKPSVTRSGDEVQISFAAREARDATVTIEDARGAVVRHLASGVLGRGAPPPFRAGSLTQTVVWDGTDDAGRKVDVARCTVRVGLGLGARFDRILGWRGEAVAAVCGLTVDGTGRLYVLSSAYKKPTRICVLDRRGRYLRSIMPYPPGLAAEKVKHLGLLELADGRSVPIVRNPISFAFYPDAYGSVPAGGLGAQTMTLAGDRLVFSNAWNFKYAAKGSARRLLVLGTDGSVPANYLGPVITGKRSPGFLHLAAAPDGKGVYAAGVGDGGYKVTRPHHAVYRVALDSPGPARAYLGDPGTPGRGEKHFNDPRGVAVDRHGNLYVADNANDRVVVFDPAGRYLGQAAVDKPGPLALHQRTDEIYALSGAKAFPAQATRLLKLSAVVGADGQWVGGGETVDSLKWDYSRLAFAVDGTADPTVVWVGCWLSKTGRFLYRMEEAGGKFGKLRPVLPPGRRRSCTAASWRWTGAGRRSTRRPSAGPATGGARASGPASTGGPAR